MTSLTPFGLLGNGSQANEAAEYAAPAKALFRAVSDTFDAESRGIIDLATRDPRFTSVAVAAAVGAPGLRRHLISVWGGSSYRTIIAQSADVSASAEIGDGCILAAQAAITAGVNLARHVIVNVGATVSHDTVVGEFTTLSPGVHVAGNCIVGAGVFIGIGAVVSHGVRIADGAVIGAGAVIVDDVDLQGVWVGVPARLARRTEGWLDRL